MKSRYFSLIGILLLSLVGATSASAQELWSNPATWGGTVPGPGAHVVIPQARRIVLDVNPPPLGSITVHGALAYADKDIDLTVGWIMVHGLLEIGTEQKPYPHRATITLNGPLGDNVMGMGARFIGAMGGGALEIHGSRRADVDWAVLNAHAKPGDTTISLALVEPNKTVLGWQPGDLLVIAPSGRDPLQAEAVTVTGVSETQVSFTPALQFHHWGELQTIEGRTVDERAEVGLLTRNIVIQGAPDGFAQKLGGHIMIMAGSIGKLEGVELRHMGQMGRKGRYPIHWHLTGFGPTDYARFTSIWSSFHRAIAIHQTHGVEVRGNVAADIWSHAYVIGEDGNEIGNIVEDNLGILTKRLPDSAFVFARAGDPGSTGPAAQDEWRPATFWVNNPDNVVRRNRAAGGLDAIGFYYDDDHGLFSTQDVFHGDFAGNVAHSFLASTPAADPDPRHVSGVGLLVRMAPRVGSRHFDTFTGYQNSVAGAWLENASDVLQDATLADNASGAVIFRSTIDNAFIVGQTNNAATPHPPESIRGGVRLIGYLGGAKTPQVRRTTFVNQTPAAIYIESDHVMPGNLFEANTLIGTPVPFFLRDRTPDHSWSGGVLDLDGSLTGEAGPTMVTGDLVSTESVFKPGWGTFGPGGAYVTPQLTASGPTGLTWYAEGSTVGLAWYPPNDSSGIESYVLEAGSAPGRADLAQADVGLTTAQTIPGVSNGTYFVRVRARGPGGATQPSNEVQLVVGEPACAIPDPPTVTFALDGRTVTLQWGGIAGATSYALGVGSASGRYDVLVTTLPTTTTSIGGAVPPGTYVVRMVALNACGLSTLSNEITIIVP
jgi:hypothetical protein